MTTKKVGSRVSLKLGRGKPREGTITSIDGLKAEVELDAKEEGGEVSTVRRNVHFLTLLETTR